MPRSATDVMNDIIVAAVLDAVAALRSASGGLPNQLLRDLNAIHANTTLADLPQPLQAAIAASVRTAFTRLQKEGYFVSNERPPATRPSAPPRREGGQGPRPPRGNPAADRPRGDRPARPGPGRGPRPGGGGKPRQPR
jgi:hypothetical protein